MTRLLLLGLDCLGADVLREPLAAAMPNLATIAASGPHGVLESTLPPITVPAWTAMLTGRDPGELGVYGFRNRRTYGYGDLVLATSAMVRAPRVWDRMTVAGRPSLVVGVPQTSPPPSLLGSLVTGFEGPLNRPGAYTHPPELAREVAEVVGEYLFDVPEFRKASLEEVRDTARAMTERRFRLMRHLLRTRSWEFAMLHEIGPDRIHHCFWSHHDRTHPRHDPGTPYGRAVVDYYSFLDDRIGEMLADLPADAHVLVASDHGAKAMYGGVCVNEILRSAGLLVLRAEPGGPAPLAPDMVNWERTAAWAEGGYYSRVFFNIKGREPHGSVPPDQRDELAGRLRTLLGTVDLGDGRMLRNRVEEPARLYRRVRGLPPDLMVFFEGEHWRAIGSVGLGRHWVTANDTGVDEANHTRAGMYALRTVGSAPQRGEWRDASILDVAPTVLGLLGLPPDETLTGRDLLSWKARPAAPYQARAWYAAAGMLGRVTVLETGTGSAAVTLPVWRVEEGAHYYHVPRELLCGHREEPFLRSADPAGLRALHWGQALVTVSPYGYHGGPSYGTDPGPGTFAELADRMLDLAAEWDVSVVLSHYLFEDRDMAWITALAERGGVPLVLGADCGMDLVWSSVGEYLARLGSSRRSVRKAHARICQSALEWTVHHGPGTGPGQGAAARLFADYTARFDHANPPPWSLVEAVADGRSVDRVLMSVAEPGGEARSIMAALIKDGVLYPKFFGTVQPRADYFDLAFCRLIEYALAGGYRRIEFGGGTHQAKLLRGARLRYALGVLFVRDLALRGPALAAARQISSAKLRHFGELAARWQVDHQIPSPPAALDLASCE